MPWGVISILVFSGLGQIDILAGISVFRAVEILYRHMYVRESLVFKLNRTVQRRAWKSVRKDYRIVRRSILCPD